MFCRSLCETRSIKNKLQKSPCSFAACQSFYKNAPIFSASLWVVYTEQVQDLKYKLLTMHFFWLKETAAYRNHVLSSTEDIVLNRLKSEHGEYSV